MFTDLASRCGDDPASTLDLSDLYPILGRPASWRSGPSWIGWRLAYRGVPSSSASAAARGSRHQIRCRSVKTTSTKPDFVFQPHIVSCPLRQMSGHDCHTIRSDKNDLRMNFIASDLPYST